MHISDVYQAVGVDGFAQLVRGISMGKLKMYQIYEGFKVRAHLHKLNTETLRKAAPRLWERALANPSQYADYVLAFEGDPVWQAVHDRHLRELIEIHVTGQAPAILYRAR